MAGSHQGKEGKGELTYAAYVRIISHIRTVCIFTATAIYGKLQAPCRG
jgi:hypothetical protein